MNARLKASRSVDVETEMVRLKADATYSGPDFGVGRDLAVGDDLPDARHVHQVLVIEILGDRIAAPRSAPERRRRREAVGQRSTGRQRARLIDDETADG